MVATMRTYVIVDVWSYCVSTSVAANYLKINLQKLNNINWSQWKVITQMVDIIFNCICSLCLDGCTVSEARFETTRTGKEHNLSAQCSTAQHNTKSASA